MSGSPSRNAEDAWRLTEEAWRLAEASQVLTPVERVQLAVNRLNTAFTLREREPDRITLEALASASESVIRTAVELGARNGMAIEALSNAGGILGDVYSESVRQGSYDAQLLAEAESALSDAAARAAAMYPRGHPTRLTTTLNLAATYGRAVDGSRRGRRPVRGALRGGRARRGGALAGPRRDGDEEPRDPSSRTGAVGGGREVLRSRPDGAAGDDRPIGRPVDAAR